MTTLLIGQLAKLCGLSASALRFYDECGLLTPAATDPLSGYRTYDEEQVTTAKRIRDLRAAGLGVPSVRAFLSADSTTQRGILDVHEAAVTARTHDTHLLLRSIRSDLPEGPAMPFSLPADELTRALHQVVPIAGTDPEHPLLQTVLIEAADGSLRFVATDRHRLTVRDLPPREGVGAFTALVPSASVRRALQELEGMTGPVELVVTDKALSLRHAGGTVDVPRVAADFVDYASFLAAEADAHVLLTAVAPALAAASAAPEGDLPLAFTTEGLRVGDVLLPATYTGPAMTIWVNPAYLVEALQGAEGNDLALEVRSPLTPLVLRSADHGTQVHLLMPIRHD